MAVRILSCLVLTGWLTFAYAPMLDNGFWADDFDWVAGSIRARHDRRLWLTSEIFSKHWNPVTQLTMAWDLAWSGTSPRSYRFTNLAIHAAASLAAVALGAQMMRSFAWGFAVAALWSTSALISEPVLWISARVHALAGLLCLLSLWCHVKAAREARGAWIALGVACLALAMGAKETAVVMAGVILVAMLAEPGRSVAGRIATAMPAVGIAGVALVLRLLLSSAPPMSFDPARMVAKLLFAMDGYFLPGLRSRGEAVLGIGLGMGVLLLAACAWMRLREGAMAAALCLLPLATTLPRPKHSSRYDYLPLLGAALLLALVLRALLSRLAPRRWLRVAVAALVLSYLPSQLALVRQEELDYDRLGRAGNELLALYGDVLRGLPCSGRVAFVDVGPSRLRPLALDVARYGGMPKLIQRRSLGVAELVHGPVLTTVARYGVEPPCACVIEETAASSADRTVVFGATGAEERMGPLPPEPGATTARARITVGRMSRL